MEEQAREAASEFLKLHMELGADKTQAIILKEFLDGLEPAIRTEAKAKLLHAGWLIAVYEDLYKEGKVTNDPQN